MSNLDPKEVSKARVGPRQLKNPRSKAYAIQTLCSLRRCLESLKCDKRRVEEELLLIDQHKHWEVLGYKSRQDMIDAELLDMSEVGSSNAEDMGLVSLSAKAAQMVKDEGISFAEAGKLNGGISRQAVHKASTKNSQGEQKVDTPEWLKGNTAKALFRKLPKKLQDQAAKKEISVRGAAIKAGIIKVKTPVEKAVKAFSNLEYDDMKIAIEEINTIWDNQ